jgi:hypothetical protein
VLHLAILKFILKTTVCGIPGAEDFFDNTALKVFQDIVEGRHIFMDDPVRYKLYKLMEAAL